MSIFIGVSAFFVLLGILWYYGWFSRKEKKVYGVINVSNLNKFSRYKNYASLLLIVNIIWLLVYSEQEKRFEYPILLGILGLVINIVFLIFVERMFYYYKKIVKPLIIYVPINEKLKPEYKKMVMKWRIKMNTAIQIVLFFQIFIVLCIVARLFIQLTNGDIGILNRIINKFVSYLSITTLSGIFYYAGNYLIKDLDYIYWIYFESDYKKWMSIVL